MKINADLLHVTNQPLTDAGDAAEPEQQTVSRIMVTDGAETGTTAEGIVGSIPAAIVAQQPAGAVSRAFRTHCHLCKHFDNEAFRVFFGKADHPAAPIHLREMANQIRAGLLQTQNAEIYGANADGDGDVDVEASVRSMGFCRALEEIAKDYVAVHPLGSCPEEVRTLTAPEGLFQPRDNSAERAGNRAYDNILNRAAGKI